MSGNEQTARALHTRTPGSLSPREGLCRTGDSGVRSASGRTRRERGCDTQIGIGALWEPVFQRPRTRRVSRTVLGSLPTSLVGRVSGIVDSLLAASMLLGAVAMSATVSLLRLGPGLVVVGGGGPVAAATAALCLSTRSSRPRPIGHQTPPYMASRLAATLSEKSDGHVSAQSVIDP